MIDRALLVAGLGFGDEGKGSVVDWLVRRHRAELVVRYNGGPQAAHHVVLRDGRQHCFAQLGAGSLVPGVRTFLSRFMLVDPLALFAEVDALRRCAISDVYARLTIDPRCVIVTPFHRLLNQMQELTRGAARHGSCGRGVGQAQLDSERRGLPVLRIGDLHEQTKLGSTLQHLWLCKVDQAEQLVDAHRDLPALKPLLADLRQPHRVAALSDAYLSLIAEHHIAISESPPSSAIAVFEGAQGMLLDREHGFFPYVTPSRTSFVQAQALLDEWAPHCTRTRVGVLRAYATRHGAGPLPTEDPMLTATIPDRHNGTDTWQGAFRVGWFDAVLARYALRVCGGVDALVLTCLDRLAGSSPLRLAGSYRDVTTGIDHEEIAQENRTAWLQSMTPNYEEQAGFPSAQSGERQPYLDALKKQLGIEAAALSLGPTADDKELLDSGCGI